MRKTAQHVKITGELTVKFGKSIFTGDSTTKMLRRSRAKKRFKLLGSQHH
ncbi:MAG: hypothetical protein WAM14_03120 [Candidatus Nitrosopolaris sp.]